MTITGHSELSSTIEEKYQHKENIHVALRLVIRHLDLPLLSGILELLQHQNSLKSQSSSLRSAEQQQALVTYSNLQKRCRQIFWGS